MDRAAPKRVKQNLVASYERRAHQWLLEIQLELPPARARTETADNAAERIAHQNRLARQQRPLPKRGGGYTAPRDLPAGLGVQRGPALLPCIGGHEHQRIPADVEAARGRLLLPKRLAVGGTHACMPFWHDRITIPPATLALSTRPRRSTSPGSRPDDLTAVEAYCSHVIGKDTHRPTVAGWQERHRSRRQRLGARCACRELPAGNIELVPLTMIFKKR